MSEALLMWYAYNTNELREVKNKIYEIISKYDDEKGNLILRDFNNAREDYYENFCNGYNNWINWELCLETAEIYDKQYIELAKLFDRRSELKKELGKVKHLIYCTGNKLIKIFN